MNEPTVTISQGLFDKLTAVTYVTPPILKVSPHEGPQRAEVLTPGEYNELINLGKVDDG